MYDLIFNYASYGTSLLLAKLKKEKLLHLIYI